MRAVKEYVLKATDKIHWINMPKGAKVLRLEVLRDANTDNEDSEDIMLPPLTLFAEVESTNPLETRSFKIYGTDDKIDVNAEYVDTAIDEYGLYVMHLYELR